jgi:hypothetical protein
VTSSHPSTTQSTTSRPSDGAEVIRLLLTDVRSFMDVNILRKTIGSLPGVQSVQFRPEGRGTFTAFVTYEGMVPFAVHLNERVSRRGGSTLPAHVIITEYESRPASTIPARRTPGARGVSSSVIDPDTDAPSAA